MGQLHILNGNGHTVIPYTETEHSEAAAAVAKAMLEGRLAIADGKITHRFEPTAKRMTLTLPMAGG